MASLIAYPYGNGGECVSVEIVDPPAAFERRGEGLRHVAFERHPVPVTVRCTTDRDALERWRPTGPGGPCSLNLLLRVQSVESRFRSIIGSPLDTFVHEFVVDVKPDEQFGVLELQPVVALVTPAPAADGTARDRGSIVGWGAAFQIEIDEPPPRLGRALPIEWRHFSEDPNLVDSHLFALVAEDPPWILLNSDINGASEILNSKGTHGARARIRDAMFNSITHQVWTSLLGSAVTSLTLTAVEAESSSAEELLEEMGTWRADALRDWAMHLYTDEADVGSALSRLRDDSLADEPRLMLERVPQAIQERFGTTRAFEGFVAQQHLFEDKP